MNLMDAENYFEESYDLFDEILKDQGIDDRSFRRERDDVSKHLCNWLNIVRQPSIQLTIDGRERKFIIAAHTEMKLPFNTCDPAKKVDVALFGHGDIPYVQFEVQSCKMKEKLTHDSYEEGIAKRRKTSDTSREDTIRKLGYGLVDQLVYLRNHTDLNLLGDEELIQSVSGFYVPINRPLEKISCTWNDADLRFEIGSPQLVPFDSIPDEVKTARQVITSICRTEKEVRDFIFPLDVYSVFFREIGVGCFQATSGASIVIINTEKAKVYKHPFDERESTTLWKLVGKESPPSVCFPISSKVINFFRFFEYPLYNKQKSYEEIRRDGLVPFLNQVSKAVNELHSLDLCHLDIRIDNICFTADGNAILINLDRSVPANTPITRMRDYGKSTMYKTTLTQRSWTVVNLDWKQVAIMVYAILNDVTSANKYHQIEITQPETETGLPSNEETETGLPSVLYFMFTRGLCHLYEWPRVCTIMKLR